MSGGIAVKKLRIPGILATALLVSLLSGCAKSSLPVGEYTFGDVAYMGLISSATREYMVETKSGTEYSIQDDSLRVSGRGDETAYSNITYKRERLTDKLIAKHYESDEFQPLAGFFAPYTRRYRFSLYDEYGEQIHTYIFLLDGEVFISRFAREDILVFSIDRIVKQED